MLNLFLSFEQFLEKLFGYEFVVHFEDSVVFIAGIFLGMIIMSCLSGRVVFKLQKVSNLGSSNIKLIKFVHEGNNHYIADPKNVGESIETLLLVIFRPLFQVKEYNYRDERRTKIFIIVLVILAIIFFILAILCITTVVVDNV
ncbi:hypothetical protein [Clostridium saccharoperbutylacetonicum]|uniref:hypothetical protein n=1 Tax=Clostridium saccharoperbutylacetonicum TaxID=36745 RepID=UPI000983B6B0|nr:hypothetical protein [Clostridium saccharoperbutylacetonicum]AQR98144.1 hypothetical protein CLSAP_54950 [Clostridium saccharoperbutylacetonicum]NSB34037.1 hypothetical protein [Clostridium saccharoperbutylacetonicum]